MSQSKGIAADVEAALVSAKWPQGRSLEQSLRDIEAVINLMTARLNNNKISVCYRTEAATDPGPHRGAAAATDPGPHQ